MTRSSHSGARSSAEEHYLDMVGVTGSIPVAPTIPSAQPHGQQTWLSGLSRIAQSNEFGAKAKTRKFPDFKQKRLRSFPAAKMQPSFRWCRQLRRQADWLFAVPQRVQDEAPSPIATASQRPK